MLERKIAWEKWDDDIIEEEAFNKSDLEDFEEGAEGIEDQLSIFQKIPKLVTTPLGIYQLHDKMSPTKQFDCWTGHTNFDITDSVKEIIESDDGVELLVILSRYRFFVGIGKLFNFRSSRTNIESLLCGSDIVKIDKIDSITDSEFGKEIKETISIIKKSLSQYKYWAIFVFPNGEIDYISANDDKDEKYVKKLILYKKAKDLSGGFMFRADQED